MKTFLVVGSAIALFLSVIFLFIWPALLKDANQMDKRTVLKELQRIESHLSSQADVLNRTNLDWAVWDDTFLFLKGEYPNYPAVNLLPETFENNQVNFMLFLDGSGSNIYQSAYDLKRKEPIRLPAEFYKDFSGLDKAQGFVMTELGLAFYSVQPVYKSDGSGTAAGSLIMGKFLDHNYVDKMGKELGLLLSFSKQKEKLGKKLAVETYSDTKMKGNLLIKELEGSGSYGISILMDREFYRQKRSSLIQQCYYIAGFSAIMLLLVLFLLDRFILSRVASLSENLRGIQERRDTGLRLPISSKHRDEITNLEQSINKVLVSLEDKNREIRDLAYIDQLTGLPNQAFLFEYYLTSLKGMKAVFFFDLDGFKRINDTLGHQAGDIFLKEIAEKVKGLAAAKNGLFARLAGDEFALLVNTRSRKELEEIAGRILSQVGKEYETFQFKAFTTASVGIAVSPQDGTTLDTLLQKADIAMYEAKSTGKNQFVFYEDISSGSYYKNLLELEHELKYAVERNELEIYYQPIMDKEGKYVVCVEALLRWNHPAKGLISPDKFIPIAEETGLINRMGSWVLEEAVKQVGKWHADGFEELSLAINLSKSQMKDGRFVKKLDEVLARYHFTPGLLQIEITESDVSDYKKELLPFVEDLRKRKVKIALDDFGVGTSSLIFLKDLPVDTIKIDRNFVRKVPFQAFDTVLLTGIYKILNELGLDCVTEGIETEEQLEYIRGSSDSKLQGYYFSKPLPAPELEKQLNKLTAGV
ncbi:EAL domain-containing protein [Bacillus infantis]|uniref:EAL domain-containing protein n=1 Tax=Bacillus infantis TaxID=324767 RepID=UPI001CD76695|nr:EAL domain-containing protein [Bacillus infantis]MCA1040438.1 EAL domain-containing protein [Bacillus infantis]